MFDQLSSNTSACATYRLIFGAYADARDRTRVGPHPIECLDGPTQHRRVDGHHPFTQVALRLCKLPRERILSGRTSAISRLGRGDGQESSRVFE